MMEEVYRKRLLEAAKEAKKCQNYDCMAAKMQDIHDLVGCFLMTAEECTLYAHAFDGVMRDRLECIKNKDFVKHSTMNKALTEDDLTRDLYKASEYLRKFLEPCAFLGPGPGPSFCLMSDNTDKRLFFWQQLGECYRILANLSLSIDFQKRKFAYDNALYAYKKSLELAKQSKMHPAHPTRLALVRGCFLLQYEIMGTSDGPFQLLEETIIDIEKAEEFNGPYVVDFFERERSEVHELSAELIQEIHQALACRQL